MLEELARRGHELESEGDYSWYHFVQAVGTTPSGDHTGMSDPRDEWGAATQETDTTDTPARELAQDPHDLPAGEPFPTIP